MANPLTLSEYIQQKQAFDPSPPPGVHNWKPGVSNTQTELKRLETERNAMTEELNKSPGELEATLQARGNRYGEFGDNAATSQYLAAYLRGTPSWNKMAPDQREALEMIAHKIARIVNGDPNYSDSWHDIAGYATLVCDRLKRYE